MRMIDNLSIQDYLEEDAISHGGVLAAIEGPEFFQHYVSQQKRKPSSEMKKGSALHCLLEDTEKFERDYAIRPDGVDRRSTKGRAILDELEASGKTILTLEEYLEVQGMYLAISAHPRAKLLIRGGVFERSYFWEDSGIRFRSRPDIIWNETIIEIKTTDDVREYKFRRKVESFGYHIQAYMQALATKLPNLIWLTVRNQPPHIVRLYQPDENTLMMGRDDYMYGRDVIKRCRDDNCWVHFDEQIHPLTLARYS